MPLVIPEEFERIAEAADRDAEEQFGHDRKPQQRFGGAVEFAQAPDGSSTP